jgi:hypothetical protein
MPKQSADLRIRHNQWRLSDVSQRAFNVQNEGVSRSFMAYRCCLTPGTALTGKWREKPGNGEKAGEIKRLDADERNAAGGTSGRAVLQ